MTDLLQPLPMLRELYLCDFTVSDTSTLLPLTQLVSVTQLKVGKLQRRRWYCSHPPNDTPLLRKLFSRLTRLQQLSVNDDWLELGALSALNSNSSSLTKLEFSSRTYGEPEFDRRLPCIPPGHPFPGLAQLRVLRIESCRVDASVLACMPQLQELVFRECGLCPRIYHDPDASSSDDEDGLLSAEDTLLTALAQLQNLRRLELLWTYIPPPRASNLALYAGLTASSHLTKLHITADKEAPWGLGAAQDVFPAGRQLQHLKELHLRKCIDLYDHIKDDFYDGMCLSANDLAGVLKACPALRSLELDNVLEPGDVTPLLGLSASCVKLDVSGEAFDDSAVPTIRQLTQLKSLVWDVAPTITLEGVAQLTALKALTNLSVNWYLEDSRRHYWEDDDEWRKDKCSSRRKSPFVVLQLKNEHPKDKTGKWQVWKQLQGKCKSQDWSITWDSDSSYDDPFADSSYDDDSDF